MATKKTTAKTAPTPTTSKLDKDIEAVRKDMDTINGEMDTLVAATKYIHKALTTADRVASRLLKLEPSDADKNMTAAFASLGQVRENLDFFAVLPPAFADVATSLKEVDRTLTIVAKVNDPKTVAKKTAATTEKKTTTKTAAARKKPAAKKTVKTTAKKPAAKKTPARKAPAKRAAAASTRKPAKKTVKTTAKKAAKRTRK